MQDEEIDILRWLANAGLRGDEPNEMFRAFCERCSRAGIPISYAMGLMDTLHPEFEGHAFEWRAQDNGPRPLQTYSSSDSGNVRETWESSAFNHLRQTGESELRREIGKGAPVDFYRLPELREEGCTDVIFHIERFTRKGSIGAMDAFYSVWGTDEPDGFTEDQLALLRRLLPTLALALKSVGSIRIVKTLARVYLGQDAASRVIDGQVARGQAETIDAIIWLSDLKDYTAIMDAARPEQIIPLLNDYSSVVIGALHRNGGNVLKLIGDGVLAIFKGPDLTAAASRALQTERELRRDLDHLNRRRGARGEPSTGLYVSLHLGTVFYGNIGSRNRLDFTVVGPAVNEVSRICTICKTTNNDALVSADFVNVCRPASREGLSPLGEFSLRGVSEPMVLYTVNRGSVSVVV
ncbi:adenylate/guanylate cyclase domain-containing protein [Sinorhizobium medicae]|uniref:Adenylate/guanylate cyclase domain-containing protein n=3 Tax=Sinorhizobium medicae TaxID=110321 RepID=A0A6G1WVM5_9HYPH|nr:adenylate/guanylate cyclase domain-containing protein [Sinorhizobium medicae]MBO1941947.1 adenylate/guanylate cyclase domain-containing protein [Sinorhizobium medicae]MDX0407976.1 adenylate/guanylate cyclase domain-containing protein [Sinorhizobium medicae]MDX0414211.1 adenylate/guanylate cyclase domain-containing protein [Sinorhizobium medicae]MDX0419810.1 adenylate/guanylate cyclase domain-containing protein [Sinorhizobium medicae]MDX0425520.1 adenylate/guanylate cyclase domain-containing